MVGKGPVPDWGLSAVLHSPRCETVCMDEEDYDVVEEDVEENDEDIRFPFNSPVPKHGG